MEKQVALNSADSLSVLASDAQGLPVLIEDEAGPVQYLNSLQEQVIPSPLSKSKFGGSKLLLVCDE